MQRPLSVEFLPDTWTNGIVPATLQGLAAATRQISLLEILLHTALWTRPPVVKGFELSVFWAWLRYFPAIDDGPPLRLRPEWSELDPHQKTILSDELGVGVTTCMLAQHLQLAEFVDTLYFLRVLLPGQFRLGRTARRGPEKAPDYISRSPAGGVVVLECKGTQSSRTALEKSIRAGIPQKNNLQRTARGMTPIEHSLVGGFFIPQASSSEGPLVLFADPEGEELPRLLADQDPRRVHRAILQVFLAKVMALVGQPALAEELVNIPLEALEAQEIMPEWQVRFADAPYQVMDQSVTLQPGQNPRRARLSLRLTPELRDALSRGSMVAAIDAVAYHDEWGREVIENRVLHLKTPHGLEWTLAVEAG